MPYVNNGKTNKQTNIYIYIYGILIVDLDEEKVNGGKSHCLEKSLQPFAGTCGLYSVMIIKIVEIV